ncbi:hypothetical protein BUZ20_10075 [Staphylococcus haemolyticus]|nr:hypothetical protein BUZ36_09345 [Staphylococcus haemolyticus]PTK85121.1 hypothetical protein BUZ20_10075 [Staphylococcus haemolyticus]
MEIPQAKQAGVGAPAKRISHGNSTSKASWGWGPSKENFTWKFYKTIILVSYPSLISFNNTFKCLCDMIGK